MLTDQHGRELRYLRFSVTDRCNLRCFYCQGMTKVVSHKDILRYEDIEKLLVVAQRLGFKKVRLTGGEPFLRRNFFDFLERLSKKFSELDFRITTNGTLINDDNLLSKLKALGIKGLNVSLDTFSRDTFEKITGKDLLHNVVDTIYMGLDLGLRIKVNVVALKGINDQELKQFIDLACLFPVDVRFIEFMPIGDKTIWKKEYYWSAEDILKNIKEMVPLIPIEHGQNSGPAKIFEIKDGRGRIGVISPLSNHFCAECNRLRFTSQGRLRPCLFSDKEFNLLGLLRSPKITLERLEKVITLIAQNKPMGFHLLKMYQNKVCSTTMVSIGG
ncbi:MAG: GTP 3',8-cyclase MoaA [Desulfonauticus sp.]|nr:GTP 3',8-cyclase MoaA [Desulfonauticus sp.]